MHKIVWIKAGDKDLQSFQCDLRVAVPYSPASSESNKPVEYAIRWIKTEKTG
ncbi:hypothetical protein [Chryseobacterium arthrosphaerae]|uniref:hypothetical protein n=1 Tax=Chryseobacterium arthrosphaerae TaxID=651561 RepID=UPI0031D9B0E0